MSEDAHDDLDAFLDEIETLEGGGEASESNNNNASSASGVSAPAAVVALAPPAISKPAVKTNVEPTKSVFSSQPVMNKEPAKPEPVAVVQHQPVRTTQSVPMGGMGGVTGGLPPPMGGFPAAIAPTSAQQPPLMHMPVHQQQHMMFPSVAQPSPQAGGQGSGSSEVDGKKRKTMRMAADKIWEDTTMADWPTDDYRLFCGNLGNEVDDSTLARTFNKYASFQKAKVVRDQRTKKSKGFGFVSLGDPADFTRALREINGKYVGNRPIKLLKSEHEDRQLVNNIKKRPKMNPNSAKKHIV